MRAIANDIRRIWGEVARPTVVSCPRVAETLLLAIAISLGLSFGFGGLNAYADEASQSAAETSVSSSPSADASAASASEASSGQSEAGYEIATDPFADAVSVDLADSIYQIEVTLEGGSGKATVSSPAEMEVFDGRAVVTLVWSSPYYDYMIVAGKKYLPVNEDGDSTFVVPATAFDEPIAVIGDTTAMSEAHEIEYELTVSRGSAKMLRDTSRQDAAAAREAASASTTASSSQGKEGVSGSQGKEGASWPWVMFGICAVLSAICVASSIVIIRRYHARSR